MEPTTLKAFKLIQKIKKTLYLYTYIYINIDTFPPKY